MKYKVLLVEDEPGLVLALTDLLVNEGYQVEAATDGEAGLRLASGGDFDLLILDVRLPGKNGFDVCRDLRQRGIQTPILMLTARGQVIDKVLGLKLGADDYLTKPYEPMELLARVEALLRRGAASAARLTDAFQFGPVEVDFRKIEVRRHGQPVELTAREFELLRYLIAERGATVTRSQLLREVWGYGGEAMTRTVDVHIGLLRQKLEDDAASPRHFLTVRGHGYRFVAQNDDD
ncbi:MAG TPA: response regulator transcription factor [Blastocatellia bacterium]|nr:response regulator transcription factor [Blastocatellia bacterium]